MYLTADGWRNRIVCQVSVNGIIQYLGLYEVWGSSLKFFSNSDTPDYIGWGEMGWTGIYNTKSTAINIPSYTGNWVRTINASPSDSLVSPFRSRVVPISSIVGVLSDC